MALELEQPAERSAAAEEGRGVRPGMGRRVIALAWPVIAQNLLETLIGVVDTLLVVRLGAAAIAGVGAALQIVFFLLAVLNAVTVGASILVAQAIGAGDVAGARRVAKQALAWGVLAALPLAALGAAAAGRLIGLLGVEADVAAVGTAYLRVSMITLPGLLLSFAAGAVLRGAGDTRTPLVVSVGANLVNAVLAYGLIYGQFGLPALGAVGSAWAAATGRALGAAVLVLILVRGRGGLSLRGRAGWRPRFGAVRRVLALGVPAAVEQALASGAFTALTVIVATLGTQQLATQRITFNALSLAFLPGFGFAIAASTLVGQSVGARRPGEAAAAARASAAWAVAWMVGVGTLYFAAAPWIIGLFSDDPGVIALGARSLRVLAAAQPLWGLLFVWSGVLRWAGDTRFPLVANSLSMWAVVGLSAGAVAFFGADLPVLWAFFIPCSGLAALADWRRFRRLAARGLRPAA